MTGGSVTLGLGCGTRSSEANDYSEVDNDGKELRTTQSPSFYSGI